MSWVTVIWSMVAGTCLTLAALHLLVWSRSRRAWANLVFALAATATAGLAACELWMMRAGTIGEFGTALRWVHVPAWVVTVSLVGFTRLYLRAGRRWLAWAYVLLRTLSLILNFLFTPNLNFREITTLRHIRYLGESISVAEGIPNPWMLIGQAGFALFLAFTVDAALTVWRRGDRRQAVVLGGAIVFFTLAGTGQVVLALWEIIHTPLTPSLFFMGVVAAMGYELSHDVLRAARLSAELCESEERMTLAAEAAGFGVWIWSIARNQVWGSERWFRLFGFAPDAAISFETVIQRIHPDDREGVERGVRRALVDQSDYALEHRVVLPDGTCRWIAARGRVYPDPRQKPDRMMGAAIDITTRKLAEMEIVRQREELAHLSRVHTLGGLASSLAHELNQPLGAILRNAEAAELFLQHPSPDLDEVRAILADVRKDGQRAGEVIDRMRRMVKRREVERLPQNLNVLAGEVVALVRPNAALRQVRLLLETNSALRPVQGDRVQLQQVMLNLLLNALDALSDNPPGSPLVTVQARPAGDRVEFSVSDNGHGIPADKLLHIFEPFFTSKPDGLGMGLAISRGIIEAHGGRLWGDNNPAGGATFTFALPTANGGDAK